MLSQRHKSIRAFWVVLRVLFNIWLQRELLLKYGMIWINVTTRNEVTSWKHTLHKLVHCCSSTPLKSCIYLWLYIIKYTLLYTFCIGWVSLLHYSTQDQRSNVSLANTHYRWIRVSFYFICKPYLSINFSCLYLVYLWLKTNSWKIQHVLLHKHVNV